MSLVPFLHIVVSGKHLSAVQAHEAMNVILDGGASEALIAGFLVALRMKGETAQELAGFARAMREKAVPVEAGQNLVDIVGTGGDGAGTFNISTVTSFVLAGAGLHVAKHGNRAISGRVGSADVLEALGVRISMTPEEAVESIREIGLGFLFAPHLHPAMKHAQSVRRELKMRTVFNFLGPLANPANAQYQVIGAPSVEVAQLMAEALSELGTVHSYVVHGHDGLDEISTTGPTQVFEVWKGSYKRHVWTPADFGLPTASLDALAGGDAADNAEITRKILNGERGARRDIVLANAAAGLLASGIYESHRDAMERAAESIDSGRAVDVLEQLKRKYPVS
jgi:anthranilate phosphoribosyltransferase